jgi:hypothetical protein
MRFMYGDFANPLLAGSEHAGFKHMLAQNMSGCAKEKQNQLKNLGEGLVHSCFFESSFDQYPDFYAKSFHLYEQAIRGYFLSIQTNHSYGAIIQEYVEKPLQALKTFTELLDS